MVVREGGLSVSSVGWHVGRILCVVVHNCKKRMSLTGSMVDARQMTQDQQWRPLLFGSKCVATHA
jgi:hypothetical protein